VSYTDYFQPAFISPHLRWNVIKRLIADRKSNVSLWLAFASKTLIEFNQTVLRLSLSFRFIWASR